MNGPKDGREKTLMWELENWGWVISKAKGQSKEHRGERSPHHRPYLHHVSIPHPASPFPLAGLLQRFLVWEGEELQQKKGQNRGTMKICLKLENFVKQNLFQYSQPIATTTFLPPSPIKQQIILIKEKKVKRNLKGCEKPLIISIVA